MNVLMGVKNLRFINERGFVDFLDSVYGGSHRGTNTADGFLWSGNGFGQCSSNSILTEYSPMTGKHFKYGLNRGVGHSNFAGNVSISGDYGFVTFCSQYFGVNKNVVFEEMVIGRSPFIGVFS